MTDEITLSNNRQLVESRTDKYFSKSKAIVERFGDKKVVYGVFMRHDVICAITPAIELIEKLYHSPTVPLKITRLHDEGAFVPAQKVLFIVEASMAAFVELETLFLQKVGTACISAYNAYKQCKGLPKVAFIDMHARHAPGDDTSMLAAYGASVGSRRAKMDGAIGFVGTSQDNIAHYYGMTKGIGTMPHAIIGYAGSTVKAAQMYAETFPGEPITVLVDYFGREVTDSLEVADWWAKRVGDPTATGLSVRLDTHGGRFCEGLDWDTSIQIVAEWMHVQTEYETVRKVMGEDAFDVASNEMKDKVRGNLFGPGVSVANVIWMRQRLNAEGRRGVKIVASSGFNLKKCKVFSKAGAPVDVIGTGSFLPETYSETFATADIFRYDGEFSVKVGREKLFKGLVD